MILAFSLLPRTQGYDIRCAAEYSECEGMLYYQLCDSPEFREWILLLKTWDVGLGNTKFFRIYESSSLRHVTVLQGQLTLLMWNNFLLLFCIWLFEQCETFRLCSWSQFSKSCEPHFVSRTVWLHSCGVSVMMCLEDWGKNNREDDLVNLHLSYQGWKKDTCSRKISVEYPLFQTPWHVISH